MAKREKSVYCCRECGFLSNMIDLERLKDSSFQTGLAAVLMGSFLQFRSNTERI